MTNIYCQVCGCAMFRKLRAGVQRTNPRRNYLIKCINRQCRRYDRWRREADYR